MNQMAWDNLHAEMIHFFKIRPIRSSNVSLSARSWPRYAAKERLLEEGFIPAIVWKYGIERKIILRKEDILPIAFDDGPDAHVSNLFTGRLFRIGIDDDYYEDCLVSDFKAHPVNKELYFISFARKPSSVSAEFEIPVTLTGLFGCPGVVAGAQIELMMPKVKIRGKTVPPPFLVDCSGLKLDSSIKLVDLQEMLPEDCLFVGKPDEEVVSCYDHKSLEEQQIPSDYQDPNFFRPSGKKYHLTYSGFWPRQ